MRDSHEEAQDSHHHPGAPSASRTVPFRPWVTWFAIGISAAVFLGLNQEPNPESWEALGKWGAPSPDRIWGGAYWAMVSSAVVHRAIWHLAFNLYWLWVLGTLLEQVIGSSRYLLFLLLSAVVTSGSQLAASGTCGVGASGVVYAVFGFMLVLRDRFSAFREVLSPQIVNLFLLWLVGCLIATYANVWQVGNAAHFSGLLLGWTAANGLVLKHRQLLMLPLLAVLIIASLVPLFWCPWSVTWLGLQASNAYQAADHRRAIGYYDRVLAIDAEAAWAYYNRGVSYLAVGDHMRSHADFLKASKRDPKLRIPEGVDAGN